MRPVLMFVPKDGRRTILGENPIPRIMGLFPWLTPRTPEERRAVWWEGSS